MKKHPSLTSRFAAGLTAALALTGLARADFNPLKISGYNADMVVEKSFGNLSFNNTTTLSEDGGFNNYLGGNVWFELGYLCGETNAVVGYLSGWSGQAGLPSAGVPVHGSTFSSQDGAGMTWTMAPDYTVNNTFVVCSNGVPASITNCPSTTITFTAPAPYSVLSLLDAGGGGSVTVTYTINYADGSTQTGTQLFGDWFSGISPIAWYVHGRIQNNNGSFQNLDTANDGGAPHLFHDEIALNNTSSAVKSIVIATTGGNRATVFAVSGQSGSTWVPIAVSGYNADAIVEATAPHVYSFVNLVNVIMDGPGELLNGDTWFEVGFVPGQPTYGIPAHGTTFTAGTKTFLMPADYTTNCVFYNDGQGIGTSTMTLTTPTTASALSFLGAAGNGPVVLAYTVTHADGTAETGTISVPDWFAGGTPASVPKGRFNPTAGSLDNAGTTTGALLWPINVTLTDTTSPVTSVAFVYQSGGRSMLFGVSTSTDGTTFSPVAVTGYNGDGVLEASATAVISSTVGTAGGTWPSTLVGTGASTATMDSGVQNLGNTFFEQGFDRNFPNSGLPAAGSTITSVALPDHHYTLAPSYDHANNAIFIDRTNIPSATITLDTPATYSAFSFLVSGANGGTTNQVVLNHADGTSETNVFVAPDWFGGTPYAYSSYGRINANTVLDDTSPAYNNGGFNPRLYENQFALQNVGSPVTSITISYLNAVNAGQLNARAAIFAISASAGAVAPIFNAGNVNPANFQGYEGTNFSFTTTLGGGSTNGLTYQWYSSPDQTNWTALTDGPVFSGTATTTLTATNVTYLQSGYYEMVAQNVAGKGTGSVAQATIVSALPDIPQPGDPISAYQPNGGSSPANESVEHSIDGLVGSDPGKYLNFGANGGQPFVGPIGFTTTPSEGSSVVTVVRIFTANDTQGRDPVDVEVDGSNDGGTTFTPILADAPIIMPAGRNNLASAPANPLTQYNTEVHFANTVGYTSYRVFFNHCESDAGNNSIQIGEVQLLGTRTPTPPTFVQEPPATIKVWAGASPTISVLVNGYPTNFAYQWYLNGSTPISGATGSSLTLANVTVAQSGNTYSCKVSNTAGSATSTTTTLTVIADPTGSYVSAIRADNPIAYLRLDEADNGSGDDGVIANDYVGGHDGYYTNVVLGVAGYNANDSDTAMQVGLFAAADSFATGINGISFGSPTNTPATFSVEAWANGSTLTGGSQVSGAAVVSKGFGGGGEQFTLDAGANNGFSFRFYIRNAAAAAINVNGTITNTADGNWHHLVGVCDEAHGLLQLYIDGELNATTAIPPNSGIINSAVANNFPVSIGSRNTGAGADNTLNFIGGLDEVAIYNYALSSNQVLAHYDSALVKPYFVVSPASSTNSQGSTVTFTSQAVGTSPITYQWSVSTDGGTTFAPISGATSATLTLNNAAAALNGHVYEVTATNPYGSTTSATATLTIISGPPVVEVDLPPTAAAYPGGELVLSAVVDGTEPLTYTWYHNNAKLSDGGQISGSTTEVLTISDVLQANAGNYQLFVTNAQGNAATAVCAMSVLPSVIGFNNFVGWSLIGSAIIQDANTVQLTDGVTGGQDSALWFNTPVYVGGFIATFTYWNQTPAANGPADGTAFVVQTDPRGVTAEGGGGGSLGVVGITPSLEFEFNLYNPNIPGIAIHENGVSGGYGPAGNVSTVDGNPINATIKYLNGVYSVTLVEPANSATFVTNFPVNLPALLGTNVAYIGFTGADGGAESLQQVVDFTYTPIVALTIGKSGGNLVLSWPSGSGAYVLQQTSSLTGTFVNSTAAITVVNGQNQAVVPITGTAQFFQLVLPPGQ